MPLSMNRWHGKLAIVTGGSSGIGKAIAMKLVEEGLIVVVLALQVDQIEDLTHKTFTKNGKLYAIETDVSQEENILKAFDWIGNKLGSVHILINCAGVLQPTTLIDGDTAKWKKTFEVNVLGLCITTREAIRVMKANKIDGHIVNICSITGHFLPKLPRLNVYAASKHAVKALSETLRQELIDEKLNIKISQVSPGVVDTNLLQNNGFNHKPGISSYKFLDPEDIADAVLYALSTPPHVQVHEVMVRATGEPF